MIHKEQHPLAGQTVKVRADVETIGGSEYRVEDWWDRVAGKSWMFCDGNPAAMNYGMRAGFSGLPTDDKVVYGKIGAFGHLLHISELEIEHAAATVE